MIRIVKAAAVAAILGALVSAQANADPRWWTHDRALTAGPEPKSWPDVAASAGDGVVVVGGTYVVVWEQPGPGGDQDIWLRASFDDGCTWCDPRPWVEAPSDQTRPQVEVVGDGAGTISIHVLYEQDRQIRAAVATLDLTPTPCEALPALPAPTPVVLSRPLASDEADSRPRLARASDGTTRHLHAVWQRTSTSGGTASIEYAHDLDGAGAWTTGEDLTSELRMAGAEPAAAADLMAFDGWASSVTIFFRGAADGTIYSTRSADEGIRWSSPEAVSAGPGRAAPAADSSTDGVWSTDAEVWIAGAWRAADAPHDLDLDAAHLPIGKPLASPAERDPDFERPGDVAVSRPPDRPGLDPALAVAPLSS